MYKLSLATKVKNNSSRELNSASNGMLLSIFGKKHFLVKKFEIVISVENYNHANIYFSSKHCLAYLLEAKNPTYDVKDYSKCLSDNHPYMSTYSR
jgi:hypothetical protein